jgi:glycerate kinase
MRVVVAPDSFKGSLPAAAVAEAIAQGLRLGWPELEVDCLPLADGGEGTARIWVEARGGHWQEASCCDPLGRPVTGAIGWVEDGRTAIVEAAQAAGLELISAAERNPHQTTSYGLGELLRVVLANPAVETIWITLGGTATVDGGVGCLQALGIPVLDAAGQAVPRGGICLEQIAAVDWLSIPERLQPHHPRAVQLKVASDVTNPLLGTLGAARVFGPQKGADPDMVEELEAGMQQWATATGRQDCVGIPGAGAAGGLGFALACLGAAFHSGIECVMAAVGLQERLQQADWVVTGEGKSDRQSAGGKVVSGVLSAAKAAGVPVVVLSGGIAIAEVSELEQMGAIAFADTVPCPMSLDTALAEAATHLRWSARQLAQLVRLGHQLA